MDKAVKARSAAYRHGSPCRASRALDALFAEKDADKVSITAAMHD